MTDPRLLSDEEFAHLGPGWWPISSTEMSRVVADRQARIEQADVLRRRLDEAHRRQDVLEDQMHEQAKRDMEQAVRDAATISVLRSELRSAAHHGANLAGGSFHSAADPSDPSQHAGSAQDPTSCSMCAALSDLTPRVEALLWIAETARRLVVDPTNVEDWNVLRVALAAWDGREGVLYQ